MPESAPSPSYFSAQIAEAKRFHATPSPSPDTAVSGLVVHAGGCENCTPDYQIDRTTFPMLALEFVVQGHGQLTLGGNTYALTPGSLFTYGPGIAHTIRPAPDSRLVKYFVDFEGLSAQDLLRDCKLAPGNICQSIAPAEILALFDDLIHNGLKATPFSQRITTCLLELLLLKIAETSIPHGASDSAALNTFLRCLTYIESHWLELNRLEDMATACHVDAAYLCRLFQRFHHQSPYQLLLRLKMNHAASLLRMPGQSVQQVADALGFQDAFHFSRTFKKTMGASPKHFQNKRIPVA